MSSQILIALYTVIQHVVCSVTTCSEPTCADLGLETLKCNIYFCKLMWYHKVVLMSGWRLSYCCRGGIVWNAKLEM